MGSTTIMIIEDEAVLVDRLSDKLAAEGYKVLTESNGEKGLERVRTENLDLLILDIMLPGLDGLSICRLVRNDPKIADIPIIMLTARGTEVDKIIGLETGADDYIVKPFGLGEFLARVRVQLRTPRAQPISEEVESGALKLNVLQRRAYKNDDEIKLSNKEFDLLAELMRNPNVVLSRDLILTKVWGYDYFVDKRTVDVHIRWLREKIEDDPSKPAIITTIRGIGYRFEA